MNLDTQRELRGISSSNELQISQIENFLHHDDPDVDDENIID